ncbi:peptidase [Streptomyces sp. CB01249]|uniref:C40 family peptidase n=1 Tax=Streptomyces sp. CB01249 TaxID=1703929 RepID=UPI00093E9861|nr:bifunctional lytic transglycosylase/C40 family peptidase [Streptomyces sp. CB01249]OKI92082.1 peptidase [Streptomyces sp. CB01249]
MKVLIGAVAAVAGLLLVAVMSLVTIVLTDDNAKASETTGGEGLHGVPEEFRTWILKADAACDEPALTPALLAAQLYQESKFKTSKDEATSEAGAMGPAQFLLGTFATWGRDDDGNGETSLWDIGDAVMAQGRMMCSLLKTAKNSGINDDIRRLALAGYNAGWGRVIEFGGVPPEDWSKGETYHYVEIIMSTMHRYEGPALLEVSGSGFGAKALRRASTQLGTPYSYGGGSPAGPSTGSCDGTNGYLNGRCSASVTAGYDCSSLVQYAYWPTTHLPRTAAAQYGATSNHPVARSQLKPGDLLFWSHGSSSSIYHVAIYAGDGNVLHAPRTGRDVSIAPLTSAMPEKDYAGATRP